MAPVRLSHILAGGAVYAGATWATYKFFTKPSPGDAAGDAAGGAGATGGCAFDRLARVYDSTVGAEETYMLYGLMRWWLLRSAKGDVLEISAGTGRNLPHYPWAQISSLTLADVSAPMLQIAESKYFDDLKIQIRQPGHRARFVLADAEAMVASDGAAPSEVWLRGPRQAAGSGGGVGGGGGAAREGGWRLWRRRPGEGEGAAEGRAAASGARGGSGGELGSQGSSGAGGGGGGAEEEDSGGGVPGQQPASPFGSIWRQPKRAAGAPPPGPAPAAAPPPPPAPAPARACPCGSPPRSNGSDGISGGGGGGGRGPLTTFAPASFDVVVDTFGLCSCDDPVRALRQAAALLRPGGQLLLLEHGRSSYGWLNERMDGAAAEHREKWGCWWNRDINKIVNEAGLHVESSWRWHFGTTYLIVARPTAAAAAADAAGAGDAPAAA